MPSKYSFSNSFLWAIVFIISSTRFNCIVYALTNLSLSLPPSRWLTASSSLQWYSRCLAAVEDDRSPRLAWLERRGRLLLGAAMAGAGRDLGARWVDEGRLSGAIGFWVGLPFLGNC